jgi:hypothetical protein
VMEKTAPKVIVRPDHFWPADVVVVEAGTARVVVVAGGLAVVVVVGKGRVVVVVGRGRVVVVVEADVVLVVVLEVDAAVDEVVLTLKVDGGVELPLEQAASMSAVRVSPTPTSVLLTGRPYLGAFVGFGRS